MDDYLIVLDRAAADWLQETAANITNLFKASSSDLNFTSELLTNNEVQFLDLLLLVSDAHIC